MPRFEKDSVGRIPLARAFVILPACFLGFGSKFVALVQIVRSDDRAAAEAAFAIAPMTNYLLASAGFLLLLGWAAAHGMFRDVEQPKRTMLEVDAALDARSNDSQFSRSILERASGKGNVLSS